MIILTFEGLQVECELSPSPRGGGLPGVSAASHTLTGSEIRLTLPRRAADYYRHGWQSWSLACWQPVDARVPVQKPAILQPLQTDPAHARVTGPGGSWVGAVRFEDGKVLLLGSLGTDASVELAGDVLRGWYEAPAAAGVWLVACGDETEVFEAYAAGLGDRLGRVAPAGPAPRVWCSWYSFYTAISEERLAGIIEDLRDWPIDTIQIDDGWQIDVGDWQPNEKFPSGMQELAGRIRDTGKRAGLWLAPFIVTDRSRLAREHPDWLLRDKRGNRVSAGFNWGRQLHAIDTTVPAARDWLQRLMETVREWGFDYLKLDFLYGGALPGMRQRAMPREAAYRDALKVTREAAGDAYIVTCGAPIVPSIGLCDAMRIGPDVADFWSSSRDEHLLSNPTTPGTRNAVRTTLHRLWLAPLVAVDPDVIYFPGRWNTLSAEERRMNHALAQICGFVATSDPPAWVEEAGVPSAAIRAAFGPASVRRAGPYTYEVDGTVIDFRQALGLPGPRHAGDRLLGAVLSWLGNRRFTLRILHTLNRRAAARRAD